MIGIIALLISILLPALNRARRLARATVCKSNLRQVGLGLQMYITENRGYFPGPNTSGLALRAGGVYGGLAGSPVQDWDWASPTMGRIMNLTAQTRLMTPEQARLLKFREIMEVKLRCMENETRYGTLYSGSALPGAGQPLLMSFCTPTFFHLLSSATNTGAKYALEDSGSTTFLRIPPTYTPKINAIGTSSIKIFAFEGARYWDPAKNWFDFSTDIVSAGLAGRPQGAFHSRGLGTVANGSSGEPYSFDSVVPGLPSGAKPSSQFRQASLRHNGKMQAVFFDGHVEEMTFVEASRLEYWAPKGSIVKNSIMYNSLIGSATGPDSYLFNSVVR